MFTKKTPEQILNNGLTLLTENTPLDNMYPGSIARTIIESFSYEIGTSTDDTDSLYDVAEYILQNSFLGSADEEHLELIGALLDYPRREIEVYDNLLESFVTQPIDNETYKYEISRRVHTIASSNEEALRLALLSIDGVKEISGEEYTLGTGSFSFVITPMSGYSNDSVLEECREVISKTKAYGMKFEIRMPKEITIDFSIQVITKESSSIENDTSAITNVKNKLIAYFETFEVAQGFIYNDFVQEVMNSHEKIIDFKVLGFYLDKEPVLLMNQTVAEDERIRPGAFEIV